LFGQPGRGSIAGLGRCLAKKGRCGVSSNSWFIGFWHIIFTTKGCRLSRGFAISFYAYNTSILPQRIPPEGFSVYPAIFCPVDNNDLYGAAKCRLVGCLFL